MSNLQFSEFSGISSKEWKQKIQVDLKGLDYNDTLIWQSLEGIHVKPFYHRDDIQSRNVAVPELPDVWNVGQSIFIDNITITQKLAQDYIDRGAEALIFSSEKKFDFNSLFENFPFANCKLYFHFSYLDETFLTSFSEYLDTHQAHYQYLIDPIGKLASEGNWYHNMKEDHRILDSIVSTMRESAFLSIDTSLYQNAGANMIQQLAYGMAHANEYLNHFQAQGELRLIFKVACGSNYFFEIAKLRALRILYATLATEYNFTEECHIIATPSKRNKTIYDYNLNMLRTTTECMSAVLGGADTVTNVSYDSLYHKSNEFGERISRNQLLILKSESYFDVVSNPADGSYYLETITQQLAESALALFKDIESSGGFLKQLKEGLIQKKIKESAQKEQQLFDEGKLILVGTNKYPNKLDRMTKDLELFPFVKTQKRKTLIEPIIEKRISEKLEKERLKDEKH